MTIALEIPGIRLGALLGSGGMGAVYSGVRIDSGDAVAVKVLTRERITSASERRFEREARAMLALRHAHVCAAYDFGALPGGRLYLVMERLDGLDLATHLQVRQTLPFGEAARIGVEAAAGLAAAHGAGLVHRDVKPSNLFLARPAGLAGQPAVVKVLDFGLAVLADESRDENRVTRTGEVLGTPAYMAPEQARGDRAIDPRTDIYALGAVLYHALTGQPPFGRGSPVEVLVRALTESAPPVGELRPDVPDGLASLIHRCLSRDVDGRPTTMRELGDALLPFAADASVTMSDPAALGGSRGRSAPSPSDPTRLSSERRIMTVLIASGVHEPDRVREAVERYGGEVSELPNAAQIVGVFGAERSSGDEATRAVRAGLASEAWAAAIGIGTGRADAALGLVGGDAVQGAETLTMVSSTRITTSSGVRVDTETWRRTKDIFRFDGDRVLGELDAPLASRASSAIVGREQEILELTGAVARAFEDEEALALVLLGPPGVGKTRLLSAIESRLSSVTRVTVRADSTRRFVSWSLLGEIVRGLALGPAASPLPDALAALGARLRLDVPTLYLLGVVAGVDERGPAPAGVPLGDANAMRDRLTASLGDVIEALTRASPVVLLIEDLHDADAQSLGVLDVLVHRCRSSPFVVLASAREHLKAEHPGVFDGAMVRRVPVRELSRKASIRLGIALGLDEERATEVALQSAGNPLFIEQLALHHLERAASRAGSADDTPALPLTVEEAIQARLDPLPKASRDALRMAAVFGGRFTPEALDALGADGAQRLITQWVRDDLVMPERARVDDGLRASDGAGRFVFRCELVREVAYAGLSGGARRELHGRIADTLARLYHQNDTTSLALGGGAGRFAEGPIAPAVIAHHEALGPDPSRAIAWWLEAARDALRTGDIHAARASLDRALPLAIGSGYERPVRFERLSVFVTAADVPAARAEMDALSLLTLPSDERAQGELAYWFGAVLQWEGQYRASRDSFQRSARAFRTLGDAAALSRALAMEAVQVCTGRLGDARPLADEAVLVAGAHASARARALHTRYYIAGYFDRPAVARDYGRAALAACEEAGDLRRALEVSTTLAAEELDLGQLASARRRLDEVVSRATRLGNRSAEGYAVHNLGVVLARSGEIHAAEAQQTRALALARALGHGRLIGAALYHRALTRVTLGDLSGAAEDIAESMPITAGTTEEASALTARAVLASAEGAIGAGLADVGRARQLIESSGQRPELEAELLATEVELLLRAGDFAAAQARRVAAVESLVSRAEALTDSPVERETYLLGTPARARLLEAPTVAG
ncbi:MAG: protein kinase [Myxococcales bacterium]|nr:protein kinase [Myxococcales bacterium]